MTSRRDTDQSFMTIRDEYGNVQGYVNPFTGQTVEEERTLPHLRHATRKTRQQMQKNGTWKGRK